MPRSASVQYTQERNGWKILGRYWKTVFSIIIPLIFLPLAISEHKEVRCAYVLILTAVFWVFEPIHLAVTSLMPVAFFPILGVMGTSDSCAPYMKSSNMMFIGGLLMAIAIESCNVHKRIALKVLMVVGTSFKRIMFGIMMTTMFLPMWISNTATTAMMVPIVDSMLQEIWESSRHEKDPEGGELKESSVEVEQKSKEQLEKTSEEDAFKLKEFATIKKALLLSCAYSANIGGTGTLTGTGTNLILQGLIYDLYPNATDLTFATWFFYAAPGMILCVLTAWMLLTFLFLRKRSVVSDKQEKTIQSLIERKYEELGPIRFQECAVVAFFVTLVAFWLFREPEFITGWAGLVQRKGIKIKDGTPAIFIALLMFITPANFSQFHDFNKPFTKAKTLLDWRTVQRKMPWGVVILLGGGFALAEGTTQSGLSEWFGSQVIRLNLSSARLAMVALIVFSALITEVASNTATASVLLPVVNQLAVAMEVHPLMLMLPVTLGCSFAFMFPVATPPNAIVFDYLQIKPIEMIKPGIAMNILCIIIELLMVITWGYKIFDLGAIPANWTPTSLNGTLHPK